MADPQDTETPEDERVEVTADDDETVTDPVEDPEGDTPEDDTTDTTDDDAAGDTGEGEEGATEDVATTRGNRAIGTLRAERRRLAEENARLTRDLDEARRRPAAPAQPVETASQRAERMALLTPEERIREEVKEALDRNEQKTQQLYSQLAEQSDRTAFEAQASASPILKKLAPEVERRLADLRRGGQNLPRSVVATYIIGERALAQAGKPKPGAQQRQRQQQSRPANGRGDVASTRQRRGTDSAADLEARFGDVPI